MRNKFIRYSLICIILATVPACKAMQGSWLALATPTAMVTSTAAAESTPLLSSSLLTPTQLVTAGPAVLSTEILVSPTPPPSPVSPVPTSTPETIPTPTDTLPAADTNPSLTSANQLRVFEELWGVIRDQYLYADFNGLDWEAIGQEYRARIAAGVDDPQFYAMMHEVVRRLGDEHSTYFSPQEAAQRDQEFQGNSSYVGIGVLTAPVPERLALTILLVFPGSPAEAAGLLVHDSLLAVDGQPLIDANGARMGLLRGPEGTTIELTAQTPGQAPRQLRITRRPVNAQMPTPHSSLLTPNGKRIGYLYIPTFNEINVDTQVGQALSSLSAAGAMDGLILDLRHNGGGASDVLINTLSYFINGPVGYFVERGKEQELAVRGQSVGGSLEIPLIVLVGEGTASFAEVFAGSLQNLGRAYILGEVTDGNVEVLSIFNFSDSSRAWIATSSFRPYNTTSQNWEETGIIPDQVITSEWDLVTLQTDPVILAALAHFDSLSQ